MDVTQISVQTRGSHTLDSLVSPPNAMNLDENPSAPILRCDVCVNTKLW